MSGPWLASYIALWAIVLIQGAVIFLILRQLGLMYLGTAQGVARDGLAVGKRAPQFTATGLAGETVALGDFQSAPLLLVFGSPNCSPCKNLIPHLNVFAAERADDLRVLFLSRGEVEDARRFASEHNIEVPVAAHPDDALPDRFQARVTPFGFVIGMDGLILAKGLVNTREHLDMLVHMAGEELRHNPEAGRNGAAVIDPAEVRS
ncbi:MAG: redoxin domain-containing protein [Dehalococcoidia bacterium]